MMMKQGVAWPHIIAASLVIVLVLAVVLFATPAFDGLKEKLGFGFGLNAEESQAQNRANEFFAFELSPTLIDCKSTVDVGCFCTNEETAFPTDYTLEITDQGAGAKYVLRNNNGGEVSSMVFSGVVPCVGWVVGENMTTFSSMKDNKLTLRFSTSSQLGFINVESAGEIPVSRTINLNYLFYKPKDGNICILSADYAAEKRLTKDRVCV
jgi:hypothetical protein